VCGGKNREIHGDYAGVATNRIEREHPGTVGLFLQGRTVTSTRRTSTARPNNRSRRWRCWVRGFASSIRRGFGQAQPMPVDRLAGAMSDEPYTLATSRKSSLHDLLAEKEKIVAEHVHDADR